MGIFRKQRFTCGGCGRSKTAKLTVPPDEARDPIAPPPGWYVTNMTAQDPTYGAIASVSVFCCSEPCGDGLAAGKGVALPFLTNFKAFLAGQGANQAVTDVESADEDDVDEPEYGDDDDTGPNVPRA